MTRTLLSIGCNVYEHLPPLASAESDAKRLFSTLLKPEIGDYDPALSKLLLSPSEGEIRSTLKHILFNNQTPETLTLTFAGHGAVRAGSFYMAARDSHPEALSATSFALADLFRMIAEAAPRQTYIIIDACEAGGLIEDLNVILKSGLIGKLGTPGVSLLATAASNESAREDCDGGFGTAALLNCINGKTLIQDTSAVLDLVEIGRAVSVRVGDQGGQTPVVWGLNLYGPPSFCKNPHCETGNLPLRRLLVAWPLPESSEDFKKLIQNLWEPYVTVSNNWNARIFVDQLAPIFARLSESHSALGNFAQRIASDFGVRAASSNDIVREIEVRAACAVALLPYAGKAEVAREIFAMNLAIAQRVEGVLADVVALISDYKFGLVNNGFADLFYLPINLTRLLGWAGYIYHVRVAEGRDIDKYKELLVGLFSSLSETYSLSFVSMSDEQAAPVAIALSAMAGCNLIEMGERLASCLFHSALGCEGRVAISSIDPEKVLTYLIARQKQVLADHLDLVGQPTELVTVLLRAARYFDLVDVFDLSLHHLDHLVISAYLPEAYSGFGEKQIEGGVNATFRIGHEVWSIGDIERVWPEVAQPKAAAEKLAAILSSLIFPDRVPWFLLPRLDPRTPAL